MIKAQNSNVAAILGGAPVTRDVASLFGADGYAESAVGAVSETGRIIGRLRGLQAKQG
jgi:methanogenic corrinoid protein MtbC1